MRRKRLKKKHCPIDKSKLMYGIPEKIEDEEYRIAHRDFTCIASRNDFDLCGKPSVLAHIKAGKLGGLATKPPIWDSLPLCWECHHDSHQVPENEWLVRNVLLPQRRRAYKEWKVNRP
jgi:hypothetical protein